MRWFSSLVLGLRGLGGFAVLIMVFEFRNYLGLDQGVVFNKMIACDAFRFYGRGFWSVQGEVLVHRGQDEGAAVTVSDLGR